MKALGLPPGSEIVFPALTFWVVPEMARAAGLRPVFADVDPVTFNIDPAALERAITPATRAVVPTHIYGLPCDMDEVLAIAQRHGLAVIEDCAHALGATYRGEPVGTLGDAALFSFQVLKPLNTFGGGAAYTRHDGLGRRLAEIARAEPWPSEERVLRRIRSARAERALMQPSVFSATIFPILWAASFLNARPDVYLWEKVRPLWPRPDGYAERYSNVQAAVGLAALDLLDEWTETTRAHARFMSSALADCDVALPPSPPIACTCTTSTACTPTIARRVVRRSLRAGLDVEYHHMDVCPDLPLFSASRAEVPGARRTTDALQLPIHAGLSRAGPRACRAALPARGRRHAHGRRRRRRLDRMSLAGLLPYVGVFVATVVEGEVVFVGATVLVHQGRLDPAGVFAAAALGGSVGDQLYFYALRGRLHRWLDRFPTWARRRDLDRRPRARKRFRDDPGLPVPPRPAGGHPRRLRLRGRGSVPLHHAQPAQQLRLGGGGDGVHRVAGPGLAGGAGRARVVDPARPRRPRPGVHVVALPPRAARVARRELSRVPQRRPTT